MVILQTFTFSVDFRKGKVSGSLENPDGKETSITAILDLSVKVSGTKLVQMVKCKKS